VSSEAALEAAAVAAARGIRLPFDDPVGQVAEVARRTAENRSSMLQDVERGRPTEIDAINGAIALEGERLGVPTPVNRMLWNLVRSLPSTSGENP
jgi:2-dehydropantoate 2-reductase